MKKSVTLILVAAASLGVLLSFGVATGIGVFFGFYPARKAVLLNPIDALRPIKHAHSIPAPHARYHLFFDYGDAEGYRRGLLALRRTLPRRGDHDGRSDGIRRKRHRQC